VKSRACSTPAGGCAWRSSTRSTLSGSSTAAEPDSPFTITGQYFEPYRYRDVIEREVRLVFESWHRPLSWYVDALAEAGLLVERLGEVRVPDEAVDEPRARRWQRLPLFLHIRAVRP
jgi:hypothetical protein